MVRIIDTSEEFTAMSKWNLRNHTTSRTAAVRRTSRFSRGLLLFSILFIACLVAVSIIRPEDKELIRANKAITQVR
jgi:hypothetical protein